MVVAMGEGSLPNVAGYAGPPARVVANRWWLAALLAVVVVGLAGGAVYLRFWQSASAQPNAVRQLHEQGVSIAIYYPQQLPAGYTYNNDAKMVKSTIFYFSVTGPNRQLFYVSQQPVPSNFDFDGFSKKFLNPDSFSTDAGSAVVGQAGASLVGSIRTNKNTWILINTAAVNSLSQLEVIARSLELTR
jgi:hypothetical protein